MDESDHAEGSSWPNWAKRVVSVALGFHILAILAISLAGSPASPLERDLAGLFAPYVELIDQGHVHRYYAPAPPPTPIVTAELRFEDGRPTQTIRLPDRSLRPRMRYQRQLALAFHMFMEFKAGQNDPHGARRSLWGESYARHLCETHPGCSGVRLRVQQHLVPDLVRLAQMADRPGAPLPDVDDERFYTVPELVGDYPCDAP